MICRRDARLALCLALSFPFILGACGEDAIGGAPLEAVQRALEDGEGGRAEGQLRALLADGTDPRELAAYFGEAALQQDDLVLARRWLVTEEFSPETAATGFRMLGRLELREGNLAEAAKAFDKALAAGEETAGLWTDIGRLRYMGGQQIEALAAAEKAMDLDRSDPEAFRFRAQLVRDSHGPANAIPWFEAALAETPDNSALLIDYAASLGEIGMASAALEALRRAHGLDPDTTELAYLQAVLAARGGELTLARLLLAEVPPAERETPAALLLSGVLDLELGYFSSSAQTLDRLVGLQPDNAPANRLLARALLLGGNEEELVARFGRKALSRQGSPYLKTIVGRALEALDRREDAAEYLDAAAVGTGERIVPLESDTPSEAIRVSALETAASNRDFIREMLQRGRTAQALAQARRLAGRAPGSGDAQSLLGDALLAAGQEDAAVDAYARAALVRLDWSLASRLIAAYRRRGDGEAARTVLESYLAGGSRDYRAATLLARLALAEGAVGRAEALLESAIEHGARTDPQVLVMQSEAAEQRGQKAEALRFAEQAYRLQPQYRPALEALLRLTRDQRMRSRLEAKLERLPQD